MLVPYTIDVTIPLKLAVAYVGANLTVRYRQRMLRRL